MRHVTNFFISQQILKLITLDFSVFEDLIQQARSKRFTCMYGDDRRTTV